MEKQLGKFLIRVYDCCFCPSGSCGLMVTEISTLQVFGRAVGIFVRLHILVAETGNSCSLCDVLESIYKIRKHDVCNAFVQK